MHRGGVGVAGKGARRDGGRLDEATMGEASGDSVTGAERWRREHREKQAYYLLDRATEHVQECRVVPTVDHSF